jgi:hypothetical protein
MKKGFHYAGLSAVGVLALALAFFLPVRAAAQDPILTPVVIGEAVSTAAPIVVKAISPKPLPPGTQKFQGYFMNGNVAQVTLKAKGNDMALQTFPLTPEAAATMQRIIDKGGYQYGDKVTVIYDTATLKALKVKGKPSRPL